VRVSDGLPFFVAGGKPGFNDSTRLKKAGFFKLLRDDERGIGDKGYRGLPHIMIPYTEASIQKLFSAKNRCSRRRFNHRLESIRTIVEHTNSRIKHFQGLSVVPFKKHWTLHHKYFKVLINIIVIELRTHPVHQTHSYYL
jgi:hypothetical protein